MPVCPPFRIVRAAWLPASSGTKGSSPLMHVSPSSSISRAFKQLRVLSTVFGASFQYVFPCLHKALYHGHEGFGQRATDRGGPDWIGLSREEWVAAIDGGQLRAPTFAEHCIMERDPLSLQFMMGLAPWMDLGKLTYLAAIWPSVACLRLLLEKGARWNPRGLRQAALDNRLDVLEVVLGHSREWCPKVPANAACSGNVRFLMRMFEAGCPIWTWVEDGEPRPAGGPWDCNRWNGGRARRRWTLQVSADLARSGPVLLLAAQVGGILTPRMQGMLGEVRRRALALAGCFHRAYLLSRGSGRAARRWEAMGRVPVEIIQQIATQARISIVARDFVE